MNHRSKIGTALSAMILALALIAADDADNTARNVQDRDDSAVTPTDQGTGQDVEITRAIRKAVVAQDQFSVNAKNVKIITRDGIVTLRGPVESIDEKMKIGQLAEQAKGVRLVTNELEVASRD
jgi:osmotically-inducible protein OsmY